MYLIHSTMIDEADYNLIEKQMIDASPVKMIKPLNALIITDRLFGCAFGLYRFFTKLTDINAKIVSDFHSAEELVMNNKYDLIIFVGYMKNKKNYDVIKYYKYVISKPKIIMYANIDGIVESDCMTFGITHMFNRYDKITDFLDFINVTVSSWKQLLYAKTKAERKNLSASIITFTKYQKYKT